MSRCEFIPVTFRLVMLLYLPVKRMATLQGLRRVRDPNFNSIPSECEEVQ